MEWPEQERALAQRLAQRLGPRGLLTERAEVVPYEASARHGAGKARAVVRPATMEELSEAVRELIGAGAHMVVQGAATGLVGAATPSPQGTQWVLSTQRLRDVLSIDPVNRSATVAAGYRLSDLNRSAQEHGLVLPIDLGADPSVGGMVATNTGGARLIRYGGVRENLLGLQAVLAYPAGEMVGHDLSLRKNNTGLGWAQLMCGSFGALGVVGRATVKLHPVQRQCATALVALDSVEQAVELACSLELTMGEFVSAFEGLSQGALDAVAQHQGQDVFATTPPYAVLMEVSSAIAPGGGLDLETMLMAWLESRFERGEVRDAVVDKPDRLWRLRHAVSESVQALGRLVAFDVAVPRSSFAAFRHEAARIIAQCMPQARLCDFGHLGDGGVHLNMVVPVNTGVQQIEQLREAIYDAVVGQFSGSFSAEHGIGPYNQRFYERFTEGPMRSACTALQQALDPRFQLGRIRLGHASLGQA